jgi:VRR-NUC domain-containing protein
MTRRRQPEAQLQRSLVAHLQWHAKADVWWTHIPLGGLRSKIEASILRGMGTTRGTPDLLVIRAGQPIFVELKAPGRRKLSPAQVECHAALQRAGVTVQVFDDIDEALGFFRRQGVLR